MRARLGISCGIGALALGLSVSASADVMTGSVASNQAAWSGSSQMAQQRAYWGSSQAAAKESGSQHAYADEDADSAWATDSKTFSTLGTPALNVLRRGVMGSVSVESEVSPTVARVKDGDDAHAVMAGTVPLFGHRSDGTQAPVD